MDERDGIKPGKCPECGYRMDAATATRGNARPRPGDLTLCLSCGAILEFDQDVAPVAMPAGRMADLDDDTRHELRRVQLLIRTAIPGKRLLTR